MDGQLAPTQTPHGWAPSAKSVHVLATTIEGTTSALLRARRLVEGLDTRIVVLVPRLQSRLVPFNPASDDRNAVLEEHRALAASVGADVTLLFCVCQRLDDVIHLMVDPASLVIVGGRSRLWWPSREQRLVRRLAVDGYPVIFARVGRGVMLDLIFVGLSVLFFVVGAAYVAACQHLEKGGTS